MRASVQRLMRRHARGEPMDPLGGRRALSPLRKRPPSQSSTICGNRASSSGTSRSGSGAAPPPLRSEALDAEPNANAWDTNTRPTVATVDGNSSSSSATAQAEPPRNNASPPLSFVRLAHPSLHARPGRRLHEALRFATHHTAQPVGATSVGEASSELRRVHHPLMDGHIADDSDSATTAPRAKETAQSGHDRPEARRPDTHTAAEQVARTEQIAQTKAAARTQSTTSTHVSSSSSSSSSSSQATPMTRLVDGALSSEEVVFLEEIIRAPTTPAKDVRPLPIPDDEDGPDGVVRSGVRALLDETHGKLSPFTQKESLSSRWSSYVVSGDITFFDGDTREIEVETLVGVGGSGLVFRGYYGARRLLVAVKMFILPSNMSHQDYVRESLTDVAFYVLANQLSDHGLCATCRAHDFVVSSRPPLGLPQESIEMAMRRQSERLDTDGAETKFCYFVTDLVDGELGRFLTPKDDDYDPCYDVLRNRPLRDGELFQLLYFQLAARYIFDWTLLDFMLNGQFRGDNVGYRYLSDVGHAETKAHDSAKQSHATGAEARATTVVPAAGANRVRRSYAGILLCYQTRPDHPPRYLRFAAHEEAEKDRQENEAGRCVTEALRLIYFIDLGQGTQPYVRQLTERGLIGNTVVESCIVDDGFGRYWPLDELYCRDVEVSGELSSSVRTWGRS